MKTTVPLSDTLGDVLSPRKKIFPLMTVALLAILTANTSPAEPPVNSAPKMTQPDKPSSLPDKEALVEFEESLIEAYLAGGIDLIQKPMKRKDGSWSVTWSIPPVEKREINYEIVHGRPFRILHQYLRGQWTIHDAQGNTQEHILDREISLGEKIGEQIWLPWQTTQPEPSKELIWKAKDRIIELYKESGIVDRSQIFFSSQVIEDKNTKFVEYIFIIQTIDPIMGKCYFKITKRSKLVKPTI